MKKILTFIMLGFALLGFAQNPKIKQLQNKVELYNNKIAEYNKSILAFKDSVIYFNAQMDSIKFYSDTISPKIFLSKIKIPTKLMSEPSVLSDEIVLLQKGQPLEISDYTQDYFKVRVNNNYGYVYVDMVDETEDLVYWKKAKMKEEELIIFNEAEKNRIIVQQEIEYRRKEAERKKLERKNSLIKKYGQVNAQKIIDEKIWIGMTDKMALDSWGRPTDINRSVGSWGTHEQWIYYETYLYFENGKLTSWQD